MQLWHALDALWPGRRLGQEVDQLDQELRDAPQTPLSRVAGAHSRKDCPEFKSIRANNGGKVPKDYMGAYEKSLKTRNMSVKALDVAYDEPSMNEH